MTGEAVKQRVREYMRSWEMTEPGDGLLAGVSGGADSVCLLFLLDELKEELGISALPEQLRFLFYHKGYSSYIVKGRTRCFSKKVGRGSFAGVA